AAADKLDADVIVFPTRYMGELCVRGWLRQVRKSVLQDATVEFDDFLPLARRRLVVWGGEVMALPMGVDLLSIRPGQNSNSAIEFLSRAAQQVVSAKQIGDLFDPDNMRPQIRDAAFENALKEMMDAKQHEMKGQRVPVLGVGDRLAAVTSSSRNAASAFK